MILIATCRLWIKPLAKRSIKEHNNRHDKMTRFIGLNWYCLVEITKCIDFYRILLFFLEKYICIWIFFLYLIFFFERIKLNLDTKLKGIFNEHNSCQIEKWSTWVLSMRQCQSFSAKSNDQKICFSSLMNFCPAPTKPRHLNWGWRNKSG